MNESDHIRQLKAKITDWEGITRDLPIAQIEWRPSPTQWSIKQHTFHLADAFSTTIERIQAMLTEDTPKLLTFDADVWAEEHHYEQQPWLTSINDLRRQTLLLTDLANNLDSVELHRCGIHRRIAEILGLPNEKVTIEDLLRFEAGHAEEHLISIRKLANMRKVN